MHTERLVIDRRKAREFYRAYKVHRHWSEPIDWEIQRIYQLIAQGRIVIQAIESIITAGVNNDKLPRLAIVRADARLCFWRTTHGGGAFCSHPFARRANEAQRNEIIIPQGTWPDSPWRWRVFEARAPLIPIHLRPRRGLANYHLLWEAEWQRQVPGDPMLLRRIGQADAWLVVAAWDLTSVEKAVLRNRLSS